MNDNAIIKSSKQIKIYINDKQILHNQNLSFLNNIKKEFDFFEEDIYYDLIRTCEEFKFKNIIRFIYFKLKKMELNLNIDSKYIIQDCNIIEFNKILEECINGNLINSIVILNLIIRFFMI
tara:strand:- start:31 stop:393 length:363 start_codon:yes stop_codon:yes gene_type:complete